MSNSKSVTLTDGREVRVPEDIFYVIDEKDFQYVLVKSHPADVISNNVLCLDKNGMLVWQIEDIIPGDGNTFTTGRIRKDGRLEFYSNDAVWVTVERETGVGLEFLERTAVNCSGIRSV